MYVGDEGGMRETCVREMWDVCVCVCGCVGGRG